MFSLTPRSSGATYFLPGFDSCAERAQQRVIANAIKVVFLIIMRLCL